ncbi:MAG: VOC family protein [Actinomycetes bacterium]
MSTDATSTTTQTVYPIVLYRDVDAALTWLRHALGVTEHALHRDESGLVIHMELAWNGAVVMGGSLGTGSVTDDHAPVALYLVAEDPADIDALHARAAAAGAEIVRPPSDQDYGSRDVIVRDPEGNDWCFGTYRPTSPAR